MNERVKILMSVLLVLSIVCFTGTMYVYSRGEELKDEIIKVTEEKDLASQKLLTVENDLEAQLIIMVSLKKENETFNEEHLRMLAETESMAEELARGITRRVELEATINQRQKEIEELQNLNVSIANEKENLLQEVTKAKQNWEEVARLNEELSQQLQQAQDDLKEILESKNSVDLKRVVVKAPPASEIAPKINTPELSEKLTPGENIDLSLLSSRSDRLTGSVLLYNTEYDFVIIDIGKDDHVRIGAVFQVYDEGDRVGKIRVEKVYDRMSAAVVIERVGDGNIPKRSLVKSVI